MKALTTTLSVVFLLLTSINLVGQRQIEVGISTGPTFYHGDLGNEPDVQWGGVSPGIAITVRDFINNKKRYATRTFNIEGRLSWHRLKYDETKPVNGESGTELQNYGRGLSFRTDLVGASAHLVLNAWKEPYQPMAQQRFFGFFFVGVGVFYGQPKADLFRGAQDISNRYHFWEDGTIRDQAESTHAGNIIERDGSYETNLRDWYTEGQGVSGESPAISKQYSPWNIGFPMGFGIRYAITKRIKLSAEFAYYSFLTDYLDDVSGDYATRDQIAANFPNDVHAQQLAAYISDPTDRGTNGEVGPPFTSVRGNPYQNDAFTYISAEVSYRWKRKHKRRTFVSL